MNVVFRHLTKIPQNTSLRFNRRFTWQIFHEIRDLLAPKATQIAILVCSNLALQVGKLTASLTWQDCKFITSLKQVIASFEFTIRQAREKSDSNRRDGRSDGPKAGMLTTIQVDTPARKGRKVFSLRHCVTFALSNIL
ncbi:hypothetical protein AVEN_146287-1 [Araneus ventricosus]|uniref:Uncharacterized protein n=1 Tax=Araneus ventricosus TaxID=182803 RepID=A0A4Y2HMJ6_ARAVE|nr:hypothetical protein AVEN_146287-1 [Araneus ventricosus]